MMDTKKKTAKLVCLKAGQAADAKPVYLSQPKAFAADEIEVDREAGVIRNVSFVTRGPALGYGFDIDDVTLDQVQQGIAAKEKGVKCRLTHPELSGGIFGGGGTDGVEVMLGRAINPRRANGRVRGDIAFGDYAANVPGKGDVRAYLMALAESDPEVIGLSISFIRDEFEKREDKNNQTLPPACRIKEMLAVDFVGNPGANPGGLLSASNVGKEKQPSGSHGRRPEQGKGLNMNEALLKFLRFHGLSAEASEDEAQTFLEKLEGDQREIADALATKPASDGEGTSGAADNAAGGDNLAGNQQQLSAADPEPASTTDAVTAAQAAERGRYRQISALATKYALGDEFVTEQMLSGATLADVNAAVLERVAAAREPLSVSVGADRSREGLEDGMSDALCLRAGVKLIDIDGDTGDVKRDEQGRLAVRKAADRASEFRGLSMVEMGRQLLAIAGVPDAMRLSRSRVVRLSINSRALGREYGQTIALAMSTSDFSNILGETLNKSLRLAYEEAGKTWELWARRASNADFKTIRRLALSDSPDLVQRAEGGGVVYVTLSEGAETYALAEYIQGIRQTRQSIINDDLDAFTRIPGLQASAASRKEDDVCYAILTGNAALSDSVALFHASHSNLAAGGDVGAPAEATLNTMRAAMRTQTGPKGATLNIAPVHIIAPAAMEGTIKKVLESEFIPEATLGHAKNIWRGELRPVIEARLDAVSTTGWYCAADYNRIDTVEVCFLEDEPVPQAKTEVDFDTDDVKHVIRHTVAAKAIDHRGLYSNPGV